MQPEEEVSKPSPPKTGGINIHTSGILRIKCPAPTQNHADWAREQVLKPLLKFVSIWPI
jgi:hypothetical protein